MRWYRQRIDAKTEAAGPEGPEVAALKARLKMTNAGLERILAIRDALTESIASTGFEPGDAPATITSRVNTVFSQLRVPLALGKEIDELAAGLPEHVETALAVEIVSRCTSARTPFQRSAPFRFLRLGPDVGLPLLDNDETARRSAIELGDRILFGTQVAHFGAFGAVDWRRWDWLMGRLHGAAHLGRLLEGDGQWVRDTQLEILRSEGRTFTDVTAQIERLSHSFGPGPGAARRGLLQMRDELNETQAGQDTIRGLADRLVGVTPGLTPAAGPWIQALLQRDHTPNRPIQRWARWFTGSARSLLWQRLVRTVTLGPAPPPWFLTGWPLIGALLLVAGFATAAVLADGVPAVLLGAGAGAAFAVAVAMWATRWWLNLKRQWLHQKVADLLPQLPPR